jgi:hypothetical protein
VSVDGARVAVKSPRDSIQLTVGDHEIEVTKDGFTSFTDRFHVRRGGKVELAARLEPVFVPSETPPESKESKVKMEVPATRQWMSTGLKLRLGTKVRIIATGNVDAAPETDTREYYQQVPPAGRQERIVHFPEPTLPGLCLMGRIGDGRAFFVGNELSLIVTATDANSELYLGINDDLVDDNFGAWNVEIVTSPAGLK